MYDYKRSNKRQAWQSLSAHLYQPVVSACYILLAADEWDNTTDKQVLKQSKLKPGCKQALIDKTTHI